MSLVSVSTLPARPRRLDPSRARSRPLARVLVVRYATLFTHSDVPLDVSEQDPRFTEAEYLLVALVGVALLMAATAAILVATA